MASWVIPHHSGDSLPSEGPTPHLGSQLTPPILRSSEPFPLCSLKLQLRCNQISMPVTVLHLKPHTACAVLTCVAARADRKHSKCMPCLDFLACLSAIKPHFRKEERVSGFNPQNWLLWLFCCQPAFHLRDQPQFFGPVPHPQENPVSPTLVCPQGAQAVTH